MTAIAGLGAERNPNPEYWNQIIGLANREVTNINLVSPAGIIHVPRRAVAIRGDVAMSLAILSRSWDSIERVFDDCGLRGGWIRYFNAIGNIEGLGYGGRRMRIKIPLILRELRSHNGHDNGFGIPGELCCVADMRVRNTAKVIRAILQRVRPTGGYHLRIADPYQGADWLLYSSRDLWDLFGSAYDLPLFGVSDIPNWEQIPVSANVVFDNRNSAELQVIGDGVMTQHFLHRSGR